MRRMVLLAVAARRFASAVAPRWKPSATLTGRLESLLQAPAPADDPAAAARLQAWLADKRRVVVLSGAGLSTDSGIPDYRGAAGSYRKGHTPISHDEFMREESSRRRYWARALVGYGAFAAAQPNAAHDAIAVLQRAGRVSTIITQNVDGLHEKAGASEVIPLHGEGYRVACTNCGLEGCRTEYSRGADNESRRRRGLDVDIPRRRLAAPPRPRRGHDAETSRDDAAAATWIFRGDDSRRRRGRDVDIPQRRVATPPRDVGARLRYHAQLAKANPRYAAGAAGSIREGSQALRPDGDANVASFEGFDSILPCSACGGIVKPAVTFFGDIVPKDRVNRCFEALEAADGLLCVGTSLAVFSAFRFVRRACGDGLPVCVLNRGPTRCDAEDLDVLKINAGTATLADVARSLSATP